MILFLGLRSSEFVLYSNSRLQYTASNLQYSSERLHTSSCVCYNRDYDVCRY